jgi:subtilisin family serine protease
VNRTILSGAFAATAFVAAGLTAAPALAAPAAPPTRHRAPLVGADSAGVVPGQYIVVAGAGASSARTSAVADRTRGVGGAVHHQYGRSLPGFTATLTSAQLDKVRQDPDVAYVEADRVVSAQATQNGATWGLDRIDQRALPLNSAYTYTPTGSGVTAYVIDTGIRASHTEFGGRVNAGGGFSAVNDGRGTDDCAGHGTHVAGTIGGSTYGVAKAVTLVPVRVLDCTGEGTTSGVISGVDWVTSHHASSAVANMSLGGPVSSALDTAVANSIASGVAYTVAAGNQAAGACAYSPARVPAAITVGATMSTDSRDTRYSNFGTCLDLFAPGTSVTSAWYTSDAATATASGTSMASPHVAGVAALYLQGHPGATPAQVRDAVVTSATPGAVANAGTGSPNLLLYSGLSAPAGGTPATCSGTSQTLSGSLSGAGTTAIQPNGTYYRSGGAGWQVGCLSGPTGADYDLYLYHWSGSAWENTASSTGLTANEVVSYNGPAGYYYWLVVDYAGSGAYTLGVGHP